MVLVLAREQILEVLSYPDVIDVVERAHAAHAEQVAVQPERPVVHIPGSDALMVPMIAATGPDAAGVKLLMDLPSNRDVGRPPQQSTVVLVDPQTGECTAFLDGGAITLFRTAAASAVATRHLARPGTVTLGLIGAGAQAHAHLQAIRCVREVERVLVWNRTAESAARFAAATTAATGLTVKVMASPEEVVRAADVVCTLTPTLTPSVCGEWFAPGLHVNAVGAPPRPEYREIDSDGIARSRVVVDSFETALAESGDVLFPLRENRITPDHFRDELGQVIIGARPGRSSAEEITLYDSVGVGIQDIAAAHLAVDRARRAGLGTEISVNGR